MGKCLISFHPSHLMEQKELDKTRSFKQADLVMCQALLRNIHLPLETMQHSNQDQIKTSPILMFKEILAILLRKK